MVTGKAKGLISADADSRPGTERKESTMGNLDFSNNAGFSWYCIALVVVGIGLILVSALTKTRTSGIVIGVLIGAAMVVYGLYLTFVFQGGTYYISLYVIAAPAVFVLALIRAARRKRVQPAQRAKSGVDGGGQQPR